MIVTTNHDNQIITNHIAACLSTDNHFFCFHSSHAAVTIWNHHHRHNTNAINDNIQSIQLIAFLITSISLQFWFHCCTHSVLTPTASIVSVFWTWYRLVFVLLKSASLILLDSCCCCHQENAIHQKITAIHIDNNFLIIIE